MKDTHVYKIYSAKAFDSVFISETSVNRLFKYFSSKIFIRSFTSELMHAFFGSNSFVYCSGENDEQTSV